VLNLETGVPTKEGNMKTNSRSRIVMLVLLVTVFFICASVANTGVKVMTYNVDEGTDFGPIIAVLTNGGNFSAAVTQTIAEVQGSNPGLRMQLIAAEIAAAQPDLVGLQEAAVWTFPGSPPLDFLQLILASLGPSYTPVVIQSEFHIDIVLPAGNVSFTDQDVILARTELVNSGAIKAIQQGHYSHLVPLPAFPPYLPNTSAITRGWAYADVLLNGTKFRFITTHLEDGTNTISPIFALVQAQQEIELVYSPAFTLLPVIIGGDFNTVANNSSSPTFLTYLFMLGNGFIDAWRKAHPFHVGATCCQEDLTSSASELTQRLDFVFTRNHIRVLGAQLVGNQEIDNLSWPSDHAAVAAELQVAPLL
jgi:endonuclease/exonuclease/phosphatase family metal-dependent hydrolase